MRLATLVLCLVACSTAAPSAGPFDATMADVMADAGSDFDRRYQASSRFSQEMYQVVAEMRAYVAARPTPEGWSEALRRWNGAFEWQSVLADAGAPGSQPYRQAMIDAVEGEAFAAYCALRALVTPGFTPSIEPRRSCADTDPEWWRAYL